MTAIVIDDSRPGILFVAYPKEHTFAEWEAHTLDITSWLYKNAPFVLVTDTTGSAPPDALERRMIADSFEKEDALWRKWCIGGAIVVESQLVRGAMTALSWLRPPPFENQTFAKREQALTWAQERLRTVG